MWIGRQRDSWDKLSCVIAMIHNTQAKHPKKPQHFNPFGGSTETVKLTADEGELLGKMFARS